MTDASVMYPQGNSDLADTFLNVHDPDNWFRDPETIDPDQPTRAVDSRRITELADALVDHIAHVIAAILDAGSERDAVNESEALHRAIEDELRSWSNDPHKRNPDEPLMVALHQRFDYTRDNNRDLGDGTGDYQTDQAEIDVTHAYLTIVNYLTYQGD